MLPLSGHITPKYLGVDILKIWTCSLLNSIPSHIRNLNSILSSKSGNSNCPQNGFLQFFLFLSHNSVEVQTVYLIVSFNLEDPSLHLHHFFSPMMWLSEESESFDSYLSSFYIPGLVTFICISFELEVKCIGLASD